MSPAMLFAFTSDSSLTTLHDRQKKKEVVFTFWWTGLRPLP